MVAVQGQLGLADEPLPCDYFDLVGGTSTGG
jgi:patatin-like phospholipase/acyl hydrolase